MCPACHSFDLDPSTSVCGGCGFYLSVRAELRLREQMVVPRKEIADDKLDYAERSVT